MDMPEDRNRITKIEPVSVSRRVFLGKALSGVATTALGFVAVYTGIAEAREKATKAVAHYRNYPNKGQVCAGCVHYIFPITCGAVAGPISPHGWCRFYKP